MLDELELYRRNTLFCDSEHASMLELADGIKQQHSRTVDRAIAGFYLVRDQIKSGMDRFDVKASETLAKGFGGCVGKNNLLIALMRALDIPARYAANWMDREVLRPLDTFGLSHLAFARIPPKLPHVVCSVFLEHDWLMADCSFDREMFNMFFVDKHNWTIDWDGRSDLLVAREFLCGDFEFFASMDEQFARNFNVLPPLFLTRPMFGIARIYSCGLRHQHRRSKKDQKHDRELP
ncbi:transglutaminase family protein [bacterium]|nr:transglutaminase family protein [bacterium]